MLTRRPWRGTAGVIAVVLFAVLTGLTPSAGAVSEPSTPDGSGSVACPDYLPYCIIVAERPAAPGTTGEQASTRRKPRQCVVPEGSPDAGEVVPCQVPGLGWFNAATACYFTAVSPAPAPSDPAWEGHYPEGAIYQMTCPGIVGTGGGWVWRATPPDGFGGAGITPEQLAERAVELLGLRGPQIGMAPPDGTTGLVGVPVWMWTEVTPTTWGPASATASVPGLSVTATARAQQIVWAMGDGSSVTCSGPGTPYRESLGGTESPTCGHIYARSSAGRAQDRYSVIATTTWQVTWAGGGQTGTLTVTRASTTTVSIGELQVLVT